MPIPKSEICLEKLAQMICAARGRNPHERMPEYSVREYRFSDGPIPPPECNPREKSQWVHFLDEARAFRHLLIDEFFASQPEPPPPPPVQEPDMDDDTIFSHIMDALLVGIAKEQITNPVSPPKIAPPEPQKQIWPTDPAPKTTPQLNWLLGPEKAQE